MGNSTKNKILNLIQNGIQFKIIGPSEKVGGRPFWAGSIQIAGECFEFSVFSTKEPKTLDDLAFLIDSEGCSIIQK
jgi:hypothetical protein